MLQRDPRYNVRMNKTLKITKIGNSAGVILPKDELARLDLEIGSELSFASKPQGFELSIPDDEFDRQMATAREIMAKRKRALRELAK